MRMREPGLHLSVGKRYRLIAQARRLRGEYLRMAVWQLVSWIARRWPRNRVGSERVEGPGAANASDGQTTSRLTI